MGGRALEQRIAAVRRFNRFYTRRIGVLEEGLSSSPFTLTEARVMYELAAGDGSTAAGLAERLEIDAGYLSRILRRFRERGLLARTPSPTDARRSILRLTAAGREAFGALDAGTRGKVGAMLAGLPDAEQSRLVSAMRAIEAVLDPSAERDRSYVLRSPVPGDMGWVVWSHGVLYAREYGWDERFEALVAEIVASFARGSDPARERCWIAEKGGENVGSVFLVRDSDEVAKLRLLLVDPRVRGLGIGRRLVGECVEFARSAGYRKVTLWTNDVLYAARRIYEEAGFRLVHEEPHRSFGHDLVGQTWELGLQGAPGG